MPKSPERCQEIREQMRNKILHSSMLYFARNGFAGTKISDLSKHIGIGQGTIYAYFDSKEDLFQEIFTQINTSGEIKDLNLLARLPIPAKQKIRRLSENIIQKLAEDENYAAKVVLNTQMMFEQNNFISADTTYTSEIYQATEKIIRQGQKEKSVVEGTPVKLADYYWSVVYLYALKRLFTSEYETISAHDLARILLRDM